MNCKRCGHALPSNNAICPNCGAMMTKDQLSIRKEINGANNPYMKRLEEIKNRNIMNKSEEKSNTNIVGYAIFILGIILLLAIIIGLTILKRM